MDRTPRSTKRRVVPMAMLTLLWSVAMAGGSAPVYISDAAADHILYSRQAWGGLGLNTSVIPPNRDAYVLQIADKRYDKGLGHHANGEILVALDGRYKMFEAEVGVQRQRGNVGSVVFKVYVDDELRFESGVMSDSDPAKPVRVSVAGAQELRLVADDAGDGITCDCANWADARLQPDAAAKTRLSSPTADVAPFARVMSWDPNRKDGARANRVQEFRAEDVFLGSQVASAPDGTITVPRWSDGRGCIGLEWPERRVLRSITLEFAEAAHVPAPAGACAEAWTGESAWQGQWQPINGEIQQQEGRWVLHVLRGGPSGALLGVQKIRWIFPAGSAPILLKRLSAHSLSRQETVELWLAIERPAAGERGQVGVYNGAIISDAAGRPTLSRDWDLTQRLHLKVRTCKPRSWKTDRTVLRFRLPGGCFGVAVEDVVAQKRVYVPHVGLVVSSAPIPADLAEATRQIAAGKTVLKRVREMPDQTFAEALAKVHNPVQNEGPMLVSLACDNRKFVVHRSGTIDFETFAGRADEPLPMVGKYTCKLIPQFGDVKTRRVSRHLHGGWLPVPVAVIRDRSVVCRQRTFVGPADDGPKPHSPGWLNRRAVCVAEFKVENEAPASASVSLTLQFLADAGKKHAATVKRHGKGVVVLKGERLLAYVVAGESSTISMKIEPGAVSLSGDLPSKKTAQYTVYLPARPVTIDEAVHFADAATLLRAASDYWNAVMAPAMQIDVPDPLLANVIRASQVHCMLAARNEAGGQRISPWISSDRYGPLESEANSIIRGMGLMGHSDFARRSLDFFIARYNQAGFLTTGYTIMGTGWHLWTLAEHFDLTQDKVWMSSVAPKVAQVCAWVAMQREKTKRHDPFGRRMPEWGLVPPGVAADWNRFAYRFAQEGHFCAGLREAARVLGQVGHPDAAGLAKNAEEFQRDVLRAYRWTQARCPVLPLSNGTWVPAYPSMLYAFGKLGDMIPREDGNRSWCYDVELGAHHLVLHGVLDPNGPDAGWLSDHMEDVWFLHDGMGDYPAERNRADWFDLGGFSKVQPYYTRIAEIYALRDDVKCFIRSYFNTIPSLLSQENLSFWEHFSNQGGWNKTHETGYFLAQTRLMLLMERGESLWLAPFVTSNWLNDGMTVSVRSAPTRFGNVGYKITSSIEKGFVDTTIDPPTRSAPNQIVLRLRHPRGKPLRSVLVDGKDHRDFDPAKAVIRLAPSAKTITVRATF